MPQLLWDASALVKRYYLEIGTQTVVALWSISPSQMLTTYIGYVETAAILQRRRNGGHLSSSEFLNARAFLDSEVFNNSTFALLSVSDASFVSGMALTERHNINATDAAILSAYLDYSASSTSTTGSCVLVASDQRLLRSAASEGLFTLNPETLSAADVPAFIVGLP